MSDFRRAFDLNIFSLFRLAQLAAPVIEESGGGAMLVITSIAGENKHGCLRIIEGRNQSPHSQYRLRSGPQKYPDQWHRTGSHSHGRFGESADLGNRGSHAGSHANPAIGATARYRERRFVSLQ